MKTTAKQVLKKVVDAQIKKGSPVITGVPKKIGTSKKVEKMVSKLKKSIEKSNAKAAPVAAKKVSEPAVVLCSACTGGNHKKHVAEFKPTKGAAAKCLCPTCTLPCSHCGDKGHRADSCELKKQADIELKREAERRNAGSVIPAYEAPPNAPGTYIPAFLDARGVMKLEKLAPVFIEQALSEGTTYIWGLVEKAEPTKGKIHVMIYVADKGSPFLETFQVQGTRMKDPRSNYVRFRFPNAHEHTSLYQQKVACERIAQKKKEEPKVDKNPMPLPSPRFNAVKNAVLSVIYPRAGEEPFFCKVLSLDKPGLTVHMVFDDAGESETVKLKPEANNMWRDVTNDRLVQVRPSNAAEVKAYCQLAGEKMPVIPIPKKEDVKKVKGPFDKLALTSAKFRSDNKAYGKVVNVPIKNGRKLAPVK